MIFQAVKKGLGTTVVGVIIGIFELVVVLMAPVYGKYVRIANSVTHIVHDGAIACVLRPKYLLTNWGQALVRPGLKNVLQAIADNKSKEITYATVTVDVQTFRIERRRPTYFKRNFISQI